VNTTGSFAEAKTAAKQSQNRNTTPRNPECFTAHEERELNGDQSRTESYLFFQTEKQK
jgi:hypothetical protein